MSHLTLRVCAVIQFPVLSFIIECFRGLNDDLVTRKYKTLFKLSPCPYFLFSPLYIPSLGVSFRKILAREGVRLIQDKCGNEMNKYEKEKMEIKLAYKIEMIQKFLESNQIYIKFLYVPRVKIEKKSLLNNDNFNFMSLEIPGVKIVNRLFFEKDKNDFMPLYKTGTKNKSFLAKDNTNFMSLDMPGVKIGTSTLLENDDVNFMSLDMPGVKIERRALFEKNGNRTDFMSLKIPGVKIVNKSFLKNENKSFMSLDMPRAKISLDMPRIKIETSPLLEKNGCTQFMSLKMSAVKIVHKSLLKNNNTNKIPLDMPEVKISLDMPGVKINTKSSTKFGGISTKTFLESESCVTKLLENEGDVPTSFLVKRKYSGELLIHKELPKAIFRDIYSLYLLITSLIFHIKITRSCIYAREGVGEVVKYTISHF